ncbi:Hypothetical predicted protein [Olea europaea subsp. europaea]|uniref:Transmembrane protein n=1 Tax=Olea europaea subsp. europaea TaxID=158383 RepID=A0A8S0TSB2_OLEEU|nr:Hypothetical predicted protein [Olea europaea subsp. europaea]
MRGVAGFGCACGGGGAVDLGRRQTAVVMTGVICLWWYVVMVVLQNGVGSDYNGGGDGNGSDSGSFGDFCWQCVGFSGGDIIGGSGDYLVAL